MIALLLTLQAPAPPAPRAIAIEHVTVIDAAGAFAGQPGRAHADRTVIIQGARILRVSPAAAARIPEGAERIDGRGLFAIPGLWDMHVHADTADLRRHLSWGITGVRDMGGDFAERQEWRRRIAAGEMPGPRIVTPGPLLAGPPATASRDRWVVRTTAEARLAVDSLARLGVDFIKVHEGLAPEVFFAILEAARAQRLEVAGHVPDSVPPVAAAEARIRVIEHLEFMPRVCMPLFQTGAFPPECPEEWLLGVFGAFARGSVFIDPTITSFRVWVNAECGIL